MLIRRQNKEDTMSRKPRTPAQKAARRVVKPKMKNHKKQKKTETTARKSLARMNHHKQTIITALGHASKSSPPYKLGQILELSGEYMSGSPEYQWQLCNPNNKKSNFHPQNNYPAMLAVSASWEELSRMSRGEVRSPVPFSSTMHTCSLL